MEYRLNIENESFLREKAKSKTDGVYKLRGCGYRVRNGRITHFSDLHGVYESVGYYMGNLGGIKFDFQGNLKLLKGIVHEKQ